MLTSAKLIADKKNYDEAFETIKKDLKEPKREKPPL